MSISWSLLCILHFGRMTRWGGFAGRQHGTNNGACQVGSIDLRDPARIVVHFPFGVVDKRNGEETLPRQGA